jgi:3-methyl-2-oxobutanoate hydroxymethyltransferase
MPVTIQKLWQWKQKGRMITTLTAWDFAIASILDQAGIDVILVGDSLANVILGHANTLPVTLDQMIYHTQAVGRGVKRALIVCDLPFLSYQESPQVAIHSAGRVLKETNAQGVKLEGGHPAMIETVEKLTSIGIPVMAHIGLTPQSIHQLGLKQQGTTPSAEAKLLEQAIELEQAGAFSVVLEHIKPSLASQITQKLAIPTIGIGAGENCDGQVLVTADLLGLTETQPPFAQPYLNLRSIITDTVKTYIKDVQKIKS